MIPSMAQHFLQWHFIQRVLNPMTLHSVTLHPVTVINYPMTLHQMVLSNDTVQWNLIKWHWPMTLHQINKKLASDSQWTSRNTSLNKQFLKLAYVEGNTSSKWICYRNVKTEKKFGEAGHQIIYWLAGSFTGQSRDLFMLKEKQVEWPFKMTQILSPAHLSDKLNDCSFNSYFIEQLF